MASDIVLLPGFQNYPGVRVETRKREKEEDEKIVTLKIILLNFFTEFAWQISSVGILLQLNAVNYTVLSISIYIFYHSFGCPKANFVPLITSSLSRPILITYFVTIST